MMVLKYHVQKLMHVAIGKVDVTAKALMKEHISIKEHMTAVVNKKNPSVK